MNIQQEKFFLFRSATVKAILSLVALIMLLLSGGCLHHTKYYKEVVLIDIHDYYASKVIQRLRSEGITVFYEMPPQKDGGVTMHLFARGSQFFNRDSANFNRNAYQILEQIELLLKNYEVEAMEIRGGVAAGNTAMNAGDCYRIKALAKTRAFKIAQYLRSRDADVNFMYVPDQILPNDRIHMTFVKYKLW